MIFFSETIAFLTLFHARINSIIDHQLLVDGHVTLGSLAPMNADLDVKLRCAPIAMVVFPTLTKDIVAFIREVTSGERNARSANENAIDVSRRLAAWSQTAANNMVASLATRKRITVDIDVCK